MLFASHLILVLHYLHTGFVLPSIIGKIKMNVEFAGRYNNRLSGDTHNREHFNQLALDMKDKYEKVKRISLVFTVSLGVVIWVVSTAFSIKTTCIDDD